MILCEIWGGTPTTTQEDEVTEVGLQARISTFRTHNFVVAAKQRSAQAAGAAAPATRKKKKAHHDDHYRHHKTFFLSPKGT